MSVKPKKKRVRCDDCWKGVWLNHDSTYPEHDHTSYRLDENFRRILATKKTEQCKKSGKRYAFHMGEFYVIERDGNGKGVKWRAMCRCGESWTGPDYLDVEALWAAHNEASQVERAA